MIIAKFFGLIALGIFATIGYAVCVLILASWVSKKYGNKIRGWARRILPEHFFADATKQSDNTRYNRSQKSLCNICCIKEIKQWFEKSGKVWLVIQSLIHRTILGKRGCHQNNNSYPQSGDRAKEYPPHNTIYHDESISKLSTKCKQNLLVQYLFS